MTYVEGFITPVPAANRDAYIAHANEARDLFAEFGLTRMVEAWEDDVPDGTHTDFRKAVQAEPGEAVLFSWFEYPDKAARDAASAKMMADPRMEEMAKAMPFDGRRMIYGGFAAIVDEGSGRGGYIDGFVLPVPVAKKDAYRTLAQTMAGHFSDHGAVRIVEAWADDVPAGKVTDYARAVRAEDGEAVVYSWIEWPDRAQRDAAWAAIMANESLKPEGEMPFDGKRMFWGGFVPVLDR